MNRIYLRRDAVTKRWCIVDRKNGLQVLESFDSRGQAIKALPIIRRHAAFVVKLFEKV